MAREKLPRKHSMLLMLAWVLCCAALYTHVALLDIYWNFINWTPYFHWPSAFCLGGIFGALVGAFFLSRVSSESWVHVGSLFLCAALLFAGIHLFPAEPVQPQGLLARVASSPLWYRLARLVVLGMPAALWVFGLTVRSRIRRP